MKALVQRVSEASVLVDGSICGQITRGLLVLLGVRDDDTDDLADLLARKVIQLRIFSDPAGKMNLNVRDVGGELLIVSQFTLYGDTGRGNRASYSRAARPEKAKALYDKFVESCKTFEVPVSTESFRRTCKYAL